VLKSGAKGGRVWVLNYEKYFCNNLATDDNIFELEINFMANKNLTISTIEKVSKVLGY